MAKIKVKNLADLLSSQVNEIEVIDVLDDEIKKAEVTPKKPVRRRQTTAASTTAKTKKLKEQQPEAKAPQTEKRPTTTRSKRKELPNQLRIDTYFKSTSKNFQLAAPKLNEIVQSSTSKSSGKENTKNGTKLKYRGRKRLFQNDDEVADAHKASEDSDDDFEPVKPKAAKGKKKATPKKQTKTPAKTPAKTPVKLKEEKPVEIIDLCLDSDDDKGPKEAKHEEVTPKMRTRSSVTPTVTPMVVMPTMNKSILTTAATRRTTKHRKISFSSMEATPMAFKNVINAANNALSISEEEAKDLVSKEVHLIKDSPDVSPPIKETKTRSNTKRRTIAAAVTPAKQEIPPPVTKALSTTRKRKPRPLPSYKVVQDTTFAVDAFQFGVIEGVTHYFLSHYHADHYIGLTRKFAMPLYTSTISANLIRAFIPIEEQYLHELELNKPVMVKDVEVTAIDANHCPGAVMFVFKLPSGKCILHTGDFRASADMESEPIFWNNDIHTIYLDTTYISDKYAFCTQFESIDKGIEMVRDFQLKNIGKRILYVCGSYVIGKEKFWHAIARKFKISKIWTEANRRKALNAMQIPEYLELLCDDPNEAEMHIIAMGKLNYMGIAEHFDQFRHKFDMVLAIRPSGWEKNSKPQYRREINLIGIEYSEHSSHNEMQRFVMYLKPKEVISTVPHSHNLLHCPQVPQKWYKYDKLTGNQKNFQTSITSYLMSSAKKEPLKREALQKTPSKAKPLVAGQLAKSESERSPQKSSPMGLVGSMRNASRENLNNDDDDDDDDDDVEELLLEDTSKPSSSDQEYYDANPFEEIKKISAVDETKLVKFEAKVKAPPADDADDDWLP